VKEWSGIETLAQEYVSICKQGYGRTIDDRTARQSEIVDEVITHIMPFLGMLARKATCEGVRQQTTYGARTLRVSASIELDDLVQESALEIHRHFGQYDPTRGGISTFLWGRALMGILRANRQHELIKVPKTNSRAGTDAPIAEDPSASVGAEPQRTVRPHYIELDAPASRDGTGELRIDQLADPQWRAPYHACEERLSMMPVLDILTGRHRDVIERRYGLNGRQATDRETLASEMGLTRERLRLIEIKALLKIRNEMRKRETAARNVLTTPR